MNSITHFLTGYLLGRIVFKKKNDHFIPFFCGMVAILPDIDQFLHLIIPIQIFEHAVITHTIIGMLILTLLYTLVNWAVGRRFLKNININFKLLIMVALAAMLSHLIIDIFTYREDIWTTNAHLYFWPLWNFSFHLNAFFHQSVFPNIYLIRLAIEIIYSAILGIYIIFYQWAYKKENPFLMFNPKLWLNYLPQSADLSKNKKEAYLLSAINIIILILAIIGIVAYF